MSFSSFPSLRLHKPTGQGVVTVRLASGGRKDLDCGGHGTAAAKAEYNRVVGLLAANGGIYPDDGADLTVAEALVKYVIFIDGYYRTGDVWVLSPARHKGSWRGKSRVIHFGPEARAVLAPWLNATPSADDYVFSPGRAEAERNAKRGTSRKTPRWASHMARNATKRKGVKRARPIEDRRVLRRLGLRTTPGRNQSPYGSVAARKR